MCVLFIKLLQRLVKVLSVIVRPHVHSHTAVANIEDLSRKTCVMRDAKRETTQNAECLDAKCIDLNSH